jgi:anti-sigma B factor antagonist
VTPTARWLALATCIGGPKMSDLNPQAMATAPGGEVRSPGPAAALPDAAVRWTGSHATVTMPEEIDVTNAEDVYDLLAAVLAKSPTTVTADMTATSFCDSAGLSALSRGQQLVSAHGAELRVALGESPVRRIFQLTGLDQIVTIEPSGTG